MKNKTNQQTKQNQMGVIFKISFTKKMLPLGVISNYLYNDIRSATIVCAWLVECI